MEGIKSFEAVVKEDPAGGSSRLQEVLKVIYESVSELNLQLPEGQRIEKSPAAVLFGAGGKLDSLALANFIVITEQKLDESFGCRVDLTQDDPFSPATGHFGTIRSLATYVSKLAGVEHSQSRSDNLTRRENGA
jgi:acyl carrier protein